MLYFSLLALLLFASEISCRPSHMRGRRDDNGDLMTILKSAAKKKAVATRILGKENSMTFIHIKLFQLLF